MKYYTVYQTTNKINGKIYIGMHETNDLNDTYLGSGKRLKRSIRYYGKEYFEKELLFIFDNRHDMINKEIELVTEEFINRKDTYNLMEGGHGGKQSPEKLAKFVKSKPIKLINDLKDPEYKMLHIKRSKSVENFKKAHSEGKIKYDTFRGKKHSDKSKLKMSNASKGNGEGYNNSQFGTCWITNEKENRKIFRGDLIPEGFRLGRKMKTSE